MSFADWGSTLQLHSKTVYVVDGVADIQKAELMGFAWFDCNTQSFTENGQL
jgi:hypothetical protein